MAAYKLRMVTFADPGIKKLLRRHFVLVWSAYDGRGQIEMRNAFTPEEMGATPLGFGSQNVKMFVALPDGNTLSQLGGYWSPEFLLPFLEFSRALDPAHVKTANQGKAAEVLRGVKEETRPDRLSALRQFASWFQWVARIGVQPIRGQLEQAAKAALRRGC